MPVKSLRSRLLLLALVGLVPTLVVCTGGTPPSAKNQDDEPAGPPPHLRHPKVADIDKLLSDQKPAEAIKVLETKLAGARKSGDDELLALLLIRRTELRILLGGYETAVRELKAEAWPKQLVPEILVELYYARALTTYVRIYGWSIRQREKVDTKGVVDLKLWTQQQVVDEATRAYASIWKRRARVDGWSGELLAPYITPSTYPAQVRGTLRDTISYLTIDHLADTSLWRADQANDLFRVDFEALLRGDGPAVDLASDAHPLEKVVSVLADLEHFHERAGRKEAAFEARLERLRRLYASYTDRHERDALTRALTERLVVERQLPWWAMGQALYAEWARSAGKPVDARAHAVEGQRAYPHSVGGEICAEIVAELDAPNYSMSTMRVDGANKPSIVVESRNLRRLYFRAYAIDVRQRLSTSKDYNLFENPVELHHLLTSASPTAAWSVELPESPDLQSHRSFVTPPLPKKGSYTILASARADWKNEKNDIVAAHLMISDLVLSTRENPDGSVDNIVVDGPTGKPLAGVDVETWSFDWQRGHQRDSTQRTDSDGVAHTSYSGSQGRSVTFLAARGDELTLDSNATYLWRRSASGEGTSALIYTDRSVYRPGQKVLWKAVAYQGRSDTGKFRVLPGRSFTVALHDANYQEVAHVQVRSNAYGSAAGEFAIPAAGRLLGAWTVTATIGGAQGVRVEEYKRPTFEVTLKEPSSPLRLNEPAHMSGEARYYFGLPVTAGQARYTVTREPVFPSWWGWYFPSFGNEGTQTIARGVSPMSADGGFEVKFLPEASAHLDERVSYRYHVSVSVTDDGGETRNAERSYRLGHAAVEADVRTKAGFYAAGRAIELAVTRTDLDGTPRAGKGSWRLLAVSAPAHAPLPAELLRIVPADDKLGEKRLVTEGDKHRARFETSYQPEQVTAQWKDAAVLQHGELASTSEHETSLTLAGLQAGIYRLRYETADDRGNKAEAFRDFVVAGDQAPPLPLVLAAEHEDIVVGDRLRLFVGSGLHAQPIMLETFRAGALIERKLLDGHVTVIERTLTEADRGGLAFTATAVRDHQRMQLTESVRVPWDNQSLKLSFSTFRDKIRPGAQETFRVTVESDGKHPARLPAGAAELLAYMYDRSLDLFAPHHPPNPLGLFPGRAYATDARTSLGQQYAGSFMQNTLAEVARATRPLPARYENENEGATGIGGMGMRGYGSGGGGLMRGTTALGSPMAAVPMELAKSAPVARLRGPSGGEAQADAAPERTAEVTKNLEGKAGKLGGSSASAEPVRSNFAETAFWKPALITDGKGEASFEFTVPDSVTSWNVWVHAMTKDLRSGSVQKETRSVKELLVRPYLPRFLREGDQAELKVVVNNAGKAKLDGALSFDIIDPETKQSKASLFSAKAESRAFSVEAGKSASLTFPVVAPRGVAQYAILARATAKSGHETYSDGELRPVPLLPSRLHLTQSRFVTLRDTDQRTMKFDDLAKNDDASRTNEQMVVTLDAQLFYTVLRALPYLIDYPYECAEQTLNRFVSTGIVSSLFSQYPAIATMADTMSRRTTQLQAWDAGDANRKMALEEAPFLAEAKGSAAPDEGPLINVLDQRIARANRDSALDKLTKMQTSLGAFPWFPGGPPSPYITLYVLYGFAKATEFKVDVPKDAVQRGWRYLALHYRSEMRDEMRKQDCCWEFLALLNYVASSYPDASWSGDAFTLAERKEILEYTFKHWKKTSPYVKGLLALTLKRMGRAADGKMVFDSVMDSAKTAPDQGTFWAQEDQSWLWYNDTIESQAFALRVLMELDPQNPKKDGLVLWLLLNKKMNQWKSTRATAEVIYSLAEYMKADHSLGVREAATVHIGARQQTYTFEPDKYVGKVQMIVPGAEVSEKSAQVTVEKQTKGVMFASATWSFATDKLPTEGRGDFFTVERKYFLRENNGKEFVLKPLSEGSVVHLGDEVEVQLAISTKHEAEYVHLRDPRGAGFEPTSVTSGYKWDLGLGHYEEVRDSGANFFFEHLPVGQYTFKYRVRATTVGTFRVGPATLQSMYAPEFSAYSAGHVLKIAGQ